MQAVGSKVFSTNSGIRSFNTKPESMVFRMGLFDFLKNHTTPEGNVSDSLDTFPEQGKRAETSLGQTTSDAVCSSSDAESVPPNTVTAQESNQENNVIDKELAAFLQKIDKVYPDKIIIGLSTNHKHLSDEATLLYQRFDFNDRNSFFAAYGYTGENRS